jgi:hypothetical protein
MQNPGSGSPAFNYASTEKVIHQLRSKNEPDNSLLRQQGSALDSNKMRIQAESPLMDG